MMDRTILDSQCVEVFSANGNLHNEAPQEYGAAPMRDITFAQLTP
jgi:hypothetical protein